ncbi:MAG: hypothetical protein KDA47_09705 [Planctomycetales bacterium]|nr:hypothetical protein [Planctomycetales bacterium]
MNEATPPRKSILESPWYWLYLFCTAGLIALMLAGPKYQARQAQLERNYQGRERANQRAAGQSPDTPLSTESDTLIRLEPLYFGLGALLVIAWAILWWQHFGRRSLLKETSTPPASSVDDEPPAPNAPSIQHDGHASSHNSTAATDRTES